MPDAETDDAQQKQRRLDALTARAQAVKGAWVRFSGRLEGKIMEVLACHGQTICERLEIRQEMRPTFENEVAGQVRRELTGETNAKLEASETEYVAALAGGGTQSIDAGREEAGSLVKKLEALRKEEARKAKCGGSLSEKDARKLAKLLAALAGIWSSLERWLDGLEQAVSAWEQCRADRFGPCLGLLQLQVQQHVQPAAASAAATAAASSAGPPPVATAAAGLPEKGHLCQQEHLYLCAQEPWGAKELEAYAQVRDSGSLI